MFGLIQVASRFRYFVLIPVMLALLLAMGCGSPSSQHKVVPVQGETGPSRSAKKPSYPSWFWNTPGSGDALFAVGMSEKYERPGASEKYATANGVKNLARSLSAQVKGGRGMERNGGRLIPRGSDMEEEISPEILKFVEEHHSVEATCATPIFTFVLLRVGEGGKTEPISSDSSTALHEEPDWVTALPAKPGYMYAIGESNLYYRETTSWSLAEKRARESLALAVESEIWSLTRRLMENARMIAGHDVINISTDVQLNRAQVVARWKNSEYGACHVLVRMPVSANTESIKNLVRSVLAEAAQKDSQKESKEKPQEGVVKKSQQEIIQEVFDELDRLAYPDQ